jgi:hypothetical protein
MWRRGRGDGDDACGPISRAGEAGAADRAYSGGEAGRGGGLTGPVMKVTRQESVGREAEKLRGADKGHSARPGAEADPQRGRRRGRLRADEIR